MSAAALPNENASGSSAGNSKSKKRSSQNQSSFTADSPYFTAYVEKEMKNLNVLTSTLKDISSKARTFGKCGVLMSEATRRLSAACKLQPSKKVNVGNTNSNDESGGGSFNAATNFDENNLDGKEKFLYEQRKNSVGSEMVDVLQVLGKVRPLDFYFVVSFQLCVMMAVTNDYIMNTWGNNEYANMKKQLKI
jgi:hypothetical protein